METRATDDGVPGRERMTLPAGRRGPVSRQGRPMTPEQAEAMRELVGFYHRNGYIRWPRLDRVDDEDSSTYKKGVELRFSAYSQTEADHIVALLDEIGMRHGRPHAKGSLVRIPVYGNDAVTRFLGMLEAAEKETRE